ncbi:hypothetical protein TSUD_94230 [Trifolium subterraneum]|uniref:Uncharacterized protein n=1 Tax=Trifolium subterraneum TaxID=3900 RepID=A0A2Z6NZS4_TRISU|nr:hypothetical protein TSUD_94230 [Trifolium subterraneum]
MEYIIFITLIFFTNFTKCSSTTNTTNTTITTTNNNNFTATSIPPMAKQEINNIIDALIGTGDTSINKWVSIHIINVKSIPKPNTLHPSTNTKTFIYIRPTIFLISCHSTPSPPTLLQTPQSPPITTSQLQYFV